VSSAQIPQNSTIAGRATATIKISSGRPNRQ
jgi:hypothetical protein